MRCKIFDRIQRKVLVDDTLSSENVPTAAEGFGEPAGSTAQV